MKTQSTLVTTIEIKDRQGRVVATKEVVTYAGLLNRAHQEGLKQIETTLLQAPNAANDMTAISLAEVVTEKGVFRDYGDANPTNVNEGATRQLAARALLDDGTALVLAPAAVAWSPASGPILSISAGGLLTAAPVYEDTLATAQGTWRGLAATLGLRVMNSENDNFGTYAGDGIDDAWQVQYFGVGNPNAAPGADGDGDGQPTGYEYYAGSNPVDGNSYFRFRIESVPGQPTRKDLVFSPRVPNRIYAVHYKLDFNSPDWEKLDGFTVLDAGPQRTVTDLNATETNKFYRVEISIP